MSKAVIDSHDVKLAPDGLTVLWQGRPVGKIIDTGRRFGQAGDEVIYRDSTGEVHYSAMACAISVAQHFLNERKER